MKGPEGKQPWFDEREEGDTVKKKQGEGRPDWNSKVGLGYFIFLFPFLPRMHGATLVCWGGAVSPAGPRQPSVSPPESCHVTPRWLADLVKKSENAARTFLMWFTYVSLDLNLWQGCHDRRGPHDLSWKTVYTMRFWLWIPLLELY